MSLSLYGVICRELSPIGCICVSVAVLSLLKTFMSAYLPLICSTCVLIRFCLSSFCFICLYVHFRAYLPFLFSFVLHLSVCVMILLGRFCVFCLLSFVCMCFGLRVSLVASVCFWLSLCVFVCHSLSPVIFIVFTCFSVFVWHHVYPGIETLRGCCGGGGGRGGSGGNDNTTNMMILIVVAMVTLMMSISAPVQDAQFTIDQFREVQRGSSTSREGPGAASNKCPVAVSQFWGFFSLSRPPRQVLANKQFWTFLGSSRLQRTCGS